MIRRLGEMINNNELEVHQFFTMHPFSTSLKKIYDSALEGIDFFNELYIKNNKTYERLAIVCNAINNVGKNMVVITGYRGCGKTNFLRLISYISGGGNNLETLEDLKKASLNYAKDVEDLKNLIRKDYEDSVTKIRNIFFGDMYKMSDDDISHVLIDYISEQLSGKCKYINFDEGGMGRNDPFSVKLFYSLRHSMDQNRKDGYLFHIVKLVDEFTKRNKWIIEENFEEIEFPTLKCFWKSVKEKLCRLTEDDSYDEILDDMKKLSLEQLFFAYTIWEYAEIIVAGREEKERKLIYLLDNIDIISDGTTNIFNNTMMGIWKFLWDTANVFSKIREEKRKEDRCFVALYDKTNIIVAMRETTAMHISGHLRDKLRAIVDHFDMSADIDKTEIMQKKIDLALAMISRGDIRSKGFIEIINCLNQLIGDRIFMRTLFQLFNNDYRTAVMCITTICVEHLGDVKKAISLMQSDSASHVFGGRGIIYRLMIDGFIEWDYFDAIGISAIKSKGHISLQLSHSYSCTRILLTILCNEQAKKAERFFVNPEESVRLADLYGMVQKLFGLDEFISIIDGMYSLRNKRFWNHLVTFDNILSYAPSIIKEYLNTNKPQTEDKDIYIRATSAGQIFASTLCTHFEYFSSRFASTSDNKSLFLFDDLCDSNQWDSVKKIVDDVYAAVVECVKSLEEYNKKVMEIKGAKHYDDILDSPYYYERQFHEERIIHNQISYLEAYRGFLFKRVNRNEDRLEEINEFLLSTMEKYLDLLKYDRNSGYKRYRRLFFSANSKNLYNELNVCIEEIRKSPNLRNGIAVTRDYYWTNYRGKKCAFMQRLENKNV